MTAKALGFDGAMANSLDALSDRDFVLETLAAAAITQYICPGSPRRS
jgi:argininosuccinate lyase